MIKGVVRGIGKQFTVLFRIIALLLVVLVLLMVGASMQWMRGESSDEEQSAIAKCERIFAATDCVIVAMPQEMADQFDQIFGQ